MQQAFAILGKVRGEESPDTARSMHNLAGVLHELKKLQEAEPMYREALRIRRLYQAWNKSDKAAQYRRE